MNPKLRSLGFEDYDERGMDLFGRGFLEKASKRIEVEKTLAKVTTTGLPRMSSEGGTGMTDQRPIAGPDPGGLMQTNILGTPLNPIPQLDTLPEAGRLKFCLINWKHITSDPWIWQVAAGYPLDLIAELRQDRPPKPMTLTEDLSRMISDEISKLEQLSAIQSVSDQFVSQIFLVPKMDGSQCPVVNLKPLIHWIAKYKFNMESARTMKDPIRKNDWMVSIDLKDAYLSVPMRKGTGSTFDSCGKRSCTSSNVSPSASAVLQGFSQNY